MILIHGECGSGKSAALRALEALPPSGFRAAYVPVPTLDFGGLARWCLDRLGIDAGQDPIATLRATSARMRLVLLIDDADRMPLDAALAARHLERESDGALAIVAACGSDQLANSAIVALAAAAPLIALAPMKSEEAAAAVRDRLSPERAPIAAPAPVRRERAPRETSGTNAGEPAPAPRAAEPAASPRASAARELGRIALTAPAAAAAAAPRASLIRPRAAETPPLAAPLATPPARTVPLALALAMAFAAFAIPVAFIAGYLLGGTREEAPTGAPVAVSAPALPDVASAPLADLPAPSPVASTATAPAPVAQRTEPPRAAVARSQPEPAPRVAPPVAQRTSAPRAPAAAPQRTPTERAPAPVAQPTPTQRAPAPVAQRAPAAGAAVAQRTQTASVSAVQRPPAASVATAPAVERPRAPSPAPAEPPPRREPPSEPRVEPSASDGWGAAPALISVEPGASGS